MLHSYFRIKNKHHKTLDFINDNLNSQEDNLSIDKKIKKLNEFQFFHLLSELMYNHPIKHFSINTISLFFKRQETNVNEDDYLPFQDYDKDFVRIPITGSYVVFNSKKELRYLVDYYFKTKEYPKETLITKLLVLSDKILEHISQKVHTIKYYFLNHLQKEENHHNDLTVSFFVDIITALEDYEKDLLKLYDEIQGKISGLSGSISNNENYTITTDNEILRKLYFGLEKFMYIDQSKTSLTEFIDVLKLGWKEHNSVIYLQMDNLQFKYFIECLNQFLSIKIPLTFIELSGNIQNKNGRIKANSIYTSVSKSIIKTKDLELIKSIFEKL
ncbi:hypothetical protein [Flavobacterium sp. KACC 22761]|uniref:hypothetical protein n=1 Tax=Flavobacterium sp. KACC 22761 TaxID=3092665 RepID=UPI002A760A7A|nr:hypothetical protein [Flavobacterium sp. KACC 22761]WPO78197.1 hypothetical protein SCB73_18190 [Flavobacterium sp. KACC 22761]